MDSFLIICTTPCVILLLKLDLQIFGELFIRNVLFLMVHNPEAKHEATRRLPIFFAHNLVLDQLGHLSNGNCLFLLVILQRLLNLLRQNSQDRQYNYHTDQCTKVRIKLLLALVAQGDGQGVQIHFSELRFELFTSTFLLILVEVFILVIEGV